jgi:SsrA-binding protein
MTPEAAERQTKNVTENRKARHDYHIEETYEAGLVLTGTEVKSLRAGECNLRDSYVEIRDGEAIMINSHISAYTQGNRFNHEPLRPRKLLLHKLEIRRLGQRVREKGYTVVPLRIYFSGSRAKVEIGLARGKHTYDKRRDLAEKDARRDMERVMAGRDSRKSE